MSKVKAVNPNTNNVPKRKTGTQRFFSILFQRKIIINCAKKINPNPDRCVWTRPGLLRLKKKNRRQYPPVLILLFVEELSYNVPVIRRKGIPEMVTEFRKEDS